MYRCISKHFIKNGLNGCQRDLLDIVQHQMGATSMNSPFSSDEEKEGSACHHSAVHRRIDRFTTGMCG